MSRRLSEALEENLGTTSFTELSVEALVRDAGVSRSAFYQHFGDKADLLRHLYAGVVEELIAAAGVWWGLPPGASKADLHDGFGVLLDVYRKHALLMRAVVEVATYDPELRREFDALMERAVGEVATHIRMGQGTGAIRRGLDPEPVAACLTWMTERVLMQVLGTTEAVEAERHLGGLVDVYWHTLYQGGAGD